MGIVRQDFQTTVPELIGMRCEKLLGIPGQTGYMFYYLKASATWFRFFVDEGVFFLDEGDIPDPVADLANGEEYHELDVELGCRGATIEEVRFEDGVLTIGTTMGKYEMHESERRFRRAQGVPPE